MFTKNILTYPLKYMNITQTYNGTTSHAPHNTGSPKDYPIDDGEKDSGQGYFYCPCDEMKIVRLYTSGTNTLWLESTKPVLTACGTETIVCMQVTHMNDSTMAKLKLGQTFKRGQAMFLEGSDGATANHFHISIGKGTMKGNGWTQNSKGKWVLNASGGTYKPENAFFIDPKFTTVKNARGLKFKNVPESYKADEYICTASPSLRIRAGRGTKHKTIGEIPTGKHIAVSEIKDGWGKVTYNGITGYSAMAYLKKV